MKAQAENRSMGNDMHMVEPAPLPPLFMEETNFNPATLHNLFGAAGNSQDPSQQEDLAFLLGGLTGNYQNNAGGGQASQAIFGLPLDFGVMQPIFPPSNPNMNQGLPPGMQDPVYENNNSYGQQYAPIPHIDFTQHEGGISPEGIRPSFGFTNPMIPSKLA